MDNAFNAVHLKIEIKKMKEEFLELLNNYSKGTSNEKQHKSNQLSDKMINDEESVFAREKIKALYELRKIRNRQRRLNVSNNSVRWLEDYENKENRSPIREVKNDDFISMKNLSFSKVNSRQRRKACNDTFTIHSETSTACHNDPSHADRKSIERCKILNTPNNLNKTDFCSSKNSSNTLSPNILDKAQIVDDISVIHDTSLLVKPLREQISSTNLNQSVIFHSTFNYPLHSTLNQPFNCTMSNESSAHSESSDNVSEKHEEYLENLHDNNQCKSFLNNIDKHCRCKENPDSSNDSTSSRESFRTSKRNLTRQEGKTSLLFSPSSNDCPKKFPNDIVCSDKNTNYFYNSVNVWNPLYTSNSKFSQKIEIRTSSNGISDMRCLRSSIPKYHNSTSSDNPTRRKIHYDVCLDGNILKLNSEQLNSNRHKVHSAKRRRSEIPSRNVLSEVNHLPQKQVLKSNFVSTENADERNSLRKSIDFECDTESVTLKNILSCGLSKSKSRYSNCVSIKKRNSSVFDENKDKYDKERKRLKTIHGRVKVNSQNSHNYHFQILDSL